MRPEGRVPLSLWQEECQSHWAEVDRDLQVGILIVGAGLAGASLACHLTALGERPLLVDRVGPGMSASGRNGGFVLLGNASEYPAQRKRFGVEAARDLIALARHNRERIIALGGNAAEWEASGSLMLAEEGDAAAHEALVQAQELLAEDGVMTQLQAPPEGVKGFRSALVIPEDGQVHPARLVEALLSQVTEKRKASIAHIDRPQREAVTISGHRIRFRHVFLTTNAHTAELWPDEAPKIVPQRAQMLATAPILPRVLPEVAYANWGYDYFRQRRDGRLLLGGRRHLHFASEETASAVPTEEVQEALSRYLERHLPFAAGVEITHRWAGTMGFSADGLPYLAQLDEAVTLLAGFTGHGLGLAVGLGAWLAEQVVDPARLSDQALRTLALLDPGHPLRGG